MDKAGAYGIQGGAALFADKMVGDYYNVMGLPVCTLRLMLEEIAPELF
jgi:septum formation protein